MNTEELAAARHRYLGILLSKAEAQDSLDDALLDRIERLLDGSEAEGNIERRESTTDVAMRSRSSIPVSLGQKKVQEMHPEINTPKEGGSSPEDTRPWKPIPELIDAKDAEPEEITKICRKCKTEFATISRVRVLCNDCFFEGEALRLPPIVGRGRKPKETEEPEKRSGRRISRSTEPIDLGNSKHGTISGYIKGCGCPPCSTARRESRARSKEAAR